MQLSDHFFNDGSDDGLFDLFFDTLAAQGTLVRLNPRKWTVMTRDGEFVSQGTGEIPAVGVDTLQKWGCWPPKRWGDLVAVAD